MTTDQRAYCDQYHPGDDADADRFCQVHHRPSLPGNVRVPSLRQYERIMAEMDADRDAEAEPCDDCRTPGEIVRSIVNGA